MTIKLICIENRVCPEKLENICSEPTRFAQLRIGVTYELEEHNDTQYKIIGPAFALPMKWGNPIFNKSYFAESMPAKDLQTPPSMDDLPF